MSVRQITSVLLIFPTLLLSALLVLNFLRYKAHKNRAYRAWRG